MGVESRRIDKGPWTHSAIHLSLIVDKQFISKQVIVKEYGRHTGYEKIFNSRG